MDATSGNSKTGDSEKIVSDYDLLKGHESDDEKIISHVGEDHISHSETQYEPPPHVFTACRLKFNDFLTKISEVFHHIIHPQQYLQARAKSEETLASREAKSHIKRSKTFLEQSRSLDVLGDGGLPTLSADLFLKPDELRTKHNIAEKLSSKAMNRKVYKSFGSKNIEGLGSITALQYDEYGNCVKGRVHPTSDEQNKQLTNLYLFKTGEEGAFSPDDEFIIRCGKIETKEKAKDFAAVIKSIIELKETKSKEKETEGIDTKGKEIELHNQPLRVVVQQLNSFENHEKKFIEAEHAQIAALNADFKDEANLLHLNVPSNKFYEVTKFARKFGPLGVLAEKLFLDGEQKSAELNLKGMATYCQWLQEDLGLKDQKLFSEEMLGSIKSIEEKVQRIEEIKASFITGTLSSEAQVLGRDELKRLNSQLAAEKTSLKSQLVDSYKKLATLQQSENINEYQRNQINLMMQLLGSNLANAGVQKIEGVETLGTVKLKKLNRGKEYLVLQTLNLSLGVVQSFNCKSGLDRTGFVHAVSLALVDMQRGEKLAWDKKLEESRPSDNMSKIFQFTENWEEHSIELNRLINKHGYKKAMAKVKAMSLEERESMEKIIQFRTNVLFNLKDIGLPITYASTGVVGFKWNSGFFENLLPLNFLPPVVLVEGKEVKLVRYNKEGIPVGITEEGHNLLVTFSEVRKA